MQHYCDPCGTSEILAYENGLDFVRVWWKEEEPFTYTYANVGEVHVEAMKRLAKHGSHLNAYINRHPEFKRGFVK